MSEAALLLVSVVIPTYQRPDLLERCLAALTEQKLDRARYEIIVVDDGPTEETRAVVGSCALRPHMPRLQYLAVTGRHGPAAARNVGWRSASAPIIAFTDDDCVPAPDWLSHGIAAMRPDVDGLMGRIVVPLSPVPTDYEQSTAGLETAEFATANCFYRRSALQQVGGFDERFTKAWREDADLFFSLLEAGCTLIREPNAVVIHPVRPAPWGISLRLQKNSVFNALLYRKHPDLYRRRIAPGPPHHYYPTVATLLVAMLAGIARQTVVARAVGALWLAFTLQFIGRRLRGTSHEPQHVVEIVITSVLIPPLCVGWRLWGALKYRVPFL